MCAVHTRARANGKMHKRWPSAAHRHGRGYRAVQCNDYDNWVCINTCLLLHERAQRSSDQSIYLPWFVHFAGNCCERLCAMFVNNPIECVRMRIIRFSTENNFHIFTDDRYAHLLHKIFFIYSVHTAVHSVSPTHASKEYWVIQITEYVYRAWDRGYWAIAVIVQCQTGSIIENWMTTCTTAASV